MNGLESSYCRLSYVKVKIKIYDQSDKHVIAKDTPVRIWTQIVYYIEVFNWFQKCT